MGIDQSSYSRTKKVFVIEGIPGCGKTTFCKSFESQNSNSEMLEEWVDGEILAEYIADMPGKATSFQFRAQRETLGKLQQAINIAKTGKMVLLDRGLFGNRCFAELQYNTGFISDEDMQKYREEFCYSKFIAEKDHDVQIVTCYLRCSAETALSRIKTRDRDGESAYTLEYLQNLIDKHEELIKPDITIDVNFDQKLECGFLSEASTRVLINV